MSIPLGDAATLGALRGVTDVLPLSGSAHEALAQLLFGHGDDLALVAVLHAAIAVAALVFLRKRAWSTLEEGLRGVAHPSLLTETQAGRDAIFVGIGSCVSALVALVADRVLADSPYGASPYVVGTSLLVSAVVVASTKLAPATSSSSQAQSQSSSPSPLASPGWAAAVLFGVAQGSAVVPGISRTGLTVASLVWLGVVEERAFELSFLAAIPALAAAALVAGIHARFVGESIVVLGAAAVVAFAVASLALRVLRAITGAAKLHWFAVYLAPLAFATLAWEYARP